MPFFPDTPGEAAKITAGAQTANDLLRTVLAAPQIRANTAGQLGQNVQQGMQLGEQAYLQPRQAAAQSLLGYVADEKDIPSVMQQYMPEAEELVHNLGNILRTDTDKYSSGGRPQLVPLSAGSRDNIRATINTLIGPARERQNKVVEGWIAAQGQALDPAVAQGLRQYVNTSGKFYAPETFQKIAQKFAADRAGFVEEGVNAATAETRKQIPGAQLAAQRAEEAAANMRIQLAAEQLNMMPLEAELKSIQTAHVQQQQQLSSLQILEQRQNMGLEPVVPGSNADLLRRERQAAIASHTARMNESIFDLGYKKAQAERSRNAAVATAKLMTVPVSDIATRQQLLGVIAENLSGDQIPQMLYQDMTRLQQAVNNFQELQKTAGTLTATILENKGGRGYEIVAPLAKELNQQYVMTAQQAGQKSVNFMFAYPGLGLIGEESKPRLRTFQLPIADAVKMQTVETSMYTNPTDLAWFMRRVYAPYLPDVNRAFAMLDAQYPNVPQGVKDNAVAILSRAVGVGGPPQAVTPQTVQPGPQIRPGQNAALGLNPGEPVTNVGDLLGVGSQPSGPLTAPQVKRREQLRGY